MQNLNISFILFTECNSNCKFCYQKYKRSKIDNSDIKFIKDIPNIVDKILERKKPKYGSFINIGISGGELLNHYELYPIYKDLLIKLNSIIKNYNDDILQLIPNFKIMSNGLFDVSMVEPLLLKTKSGIDISYDISGRYKNKFEEKLVISNITKLTADGFNPSVSFTLTRDNIYNFIDNKGFKDDIFKKVNINISYFLPMSKKQRSMCPSSDELSYFYIKAFEFGYTNIDTIKNILYERSNNLYCTNGSIISKSTDLDSLDYCGDESMIKDYCKDDINTIYGNFSNIKNMYSNTSLSCIYCEYSHWCPRMCELSTISTILAGINYKICPLKKVIEYIKER